MKTDGPYFNTQFTFPIILFSFFNGKILNQVLIMMLIIIFNIFKKLYTKIHIVLCISNLLIYAL